MDYFNGLLGDDATRLLIALSLWKVRKFLESTMRLRSACELELVSGEKSIQPKRPDGFVLPSTAELVKEVGDLITKCQSHFVTPRVTELKWTPEGAKKAYDAKKAKKGKE